MRGKSANEFIIDLKRFGKVTRKETETIFKKIALDLDSRVVYSTPVDTGRARGNWYPSIGNPSNNVEAERFDKVGLSTVSLIVSTVAEAKLGDVIWLTNNVKYIDTLEKGNSKQAPQGMVSVNVAEVAAFYGGK